MTDLHIYAQHEGKRATEWERDGKTYGWGNNKNLVLMKSRDLIHWQHALLRMDKIDPEIGCAWAPETTFDDKTGQLMVYFTMRHQNGQNKLYYAYVNERYDSLTTTPKILFEHPKEGVSAIDGDIVKVGNRYYLSYVSHEETPGIKQAYSDNITGPWIYQEAFVDPEPTACEAPNVWKRIGEEKWVLMYDCYGQIQRQEKRPEGSHHEDRKLHISQTRGRGSAQRGGSAPPMRLLGRSLLTGFSPFFVK